MTARGSVLWAESQRTASGSDREQQLTTNVARTDAQGFYRRLGSGRYRSRFGAMS
jgi:hypothetical protein